MAIESTTTAKNITSGTQLSSVGTVKTVVGLVKAVDVNGIERVLQIGDKVYAGETIVTAADGAVIVEFQNGTHLDLPRSAHIVLDAEILSAKSSVSIEQEASDEVARIAKAIAEGRDPNAVADAAAAGGTEGGDGDDGSTTPLVIDFNNSQGNVTSGFPTEPISLEFPPQQEELPPTEPVVELVPVNNLPLAGDTLIAVDEDDITTLEQVTPVWLDDFIDDNGANISFLNASGIGATDGNDSSLDEAADDSLDDSSPTVISGTLNMDFGGDGAGDVQFDTTQALLFDGVPIESGGQPVQYWVSGDGYTIVGFVTITDGESTYNKIIFSAEITDPSTGAYTFTLYGALDHAVANVEDNITLSLNFTVSDSNGDTAGGTLAVDIDDDIPVLSTAADQLSVEEDDLDNTNAVGNDEDGSTNAHIASGSLTDNFDFGADGPAATQVVSVSYDGNTYTADVNGDITITTAGWEIVVDAESGDYTFELLDNIDNGDFQEENLTEDAFSIILGVTVEDADGDQITDNVTVNVDVEDDVAVTSGLSVVFDESLGESGPQEISVSLVSVVALVGAVETVSGFTLDALNAAQGTIAAMGGADGVAGFAFDVTTGDSSGLTTSVTDLPITWMQISSTLVLGVTGYDSDDSSYTGVALSLHLDATTGVFTVIQYEALTNPTGVTSYDELLSAAVAVDYVVIDGDGDETPGTITFNVEDDGLLANADAITASATGQYTGNLLTNDVTGVDGVRVLSVTVGNTTYNIPVNGSSQLIVLASHKQGNTTIIDQTITFNSDGSYTYNVINYDAEADIPAITYTIIDGDGDTSTASVDLELLNTAFLIVNTNNPGGTSGTEQTFSVYITDNETTLATSATIQDQEGQQNLPLAFDNDVVFAPNTKYTVVVDHTGGEGRTNITDFTLYDKDGEGVLLNGSGGSDNTSLSNDGAGSPSAYDGVIYNLSVNGAGVVTVTDAIGYDQTSKSGGNSADDGQVLVLDSLNSNSLDFDLDFSDLPINGTTDLFGAVKTIDIAGSGTNEDNTILLTAQDVFDLGGGGDYTLFVTGDVGDTVDISGFDGVTPTTVNIDGVNYNSYQVTLNAHLITLNIEQDVSVT